MQISTIQPELLVPPRRLGGLLAKVRVANGLSLEEAATELGGDWNAVGLLEVETGRRILVDPEVKQLTSFYRIATSTLIPERSHLIVDVTEGTLSVGGQTATVEQSEAMRRDVLAKYLSMVYAMRDISPGNQIPLRLPDLQVLESAFATHRREIEDELRAMMTDSTGSVSYRARSLRGRLLVPAIGVLVAATTVGTLLLVTSDSGAEPGAGDPVETEIDTAVVQKRLPDGTPGPVVPRD